MNIIHIFVKHYLLIINYLDVIKDVNIKWLIDLNRNRRLLPFEANESK